MRVVTPGMLVTAMGARLDRAMRYAHHLDVACKEYGITTAPRLAAFLATVGHESQSLRYVREVWGPTPAQQRYEGRKDLGNVEPGDGFRFRGRGLIQTTGRANCRRLTQRLRARFGDAPDFERRPELLEEPRWAAMSAADYWDMHGLNAPADAGDFDAITRIVNGGFNGKEDRVRRYELAKAVLEASGVA